MMEECHRQPLGPKSIAGWSGDTMYVGDPTIVGPSHQQIANIDDEDVRRGGHVDPRTAARFHLQTTWHVLTVEDCEKPVIGVLAAPQLAWPARLRQVGVEIEPHRRNMSVDLVVEEFLFKTQAQGRNAHEVADELFHFTIVAGCSFAKTHWPMRPDVRDEIALAFGAGEVGLVWPTLAAKMVVFLEVWGRLIRVSITQSLVANRLVATGDLDVGRHHLLLLFHWLGK